MKILDSLDKLDELTSSSSDSDDNNINPTILQNVIKSGYTTRKHCNAPVSAGVVANSVFKVIMKEE